MAWENISRQGFPKSCLVSFLCVSKVEIMAKVTKVKDTTIFSLLKDVEKRKKEIKEIEKPLKFQTNGQLTLDGLNKNLHVINDVRQLISLAAHILRLELDYETAAKVLGVDSIPVFEFCSFPVSHWIEDIKAKISKLKLSEKRVKLKQLEERLNSILSPEARQEMELILIQEEMSKL